MAKYSNNQKNKLFKKLKVINKTAEKDILNLKVAELRKINELEEVENLTIKDIELIWKMQDAIEEKSLIDFITNSE